MGRTQERKDPSLRNTVTMGKRDHFVEIGRVVCINTGKDAGKLAVIVDVIDTNLVLVDGANKTGVSRGKLNMKHMALTPIKLDIARSPKTSTIEKAFVAADVEGQWKATSWAKKLEKQAKRVASSDFDRFNTMILRKKRSDIIGRALKKVKAGK